MAKYLDNSGLSRYDEKIKDYVDTAKEQAMSITSGGRSNIGTPTETGYMRIKDGDHAGTEQINLMYDLAHSDNTLNLIYETSGDWEHDREFTIPTKDYVDTQVVSKQDKLTASTGIKIDSNNYISAEGVVIEVGVEKPYGIYIEGGVAYQTYSKVIKIDALPSEAGVTGYPHGITGIKQILQAYGFTTDGFVLNAPRQNIQDNIAIYQVQKAGNIQIEVGKDRSAKTAYVVLIYAKNN